MSDLDELRAKRIRELEMMQQQSSAQNQLEEQIKSQEVEKQIKHIMSKIMSPEAQSRLANIRLARPDFARQIEVLLIQLYQGGRLTELTDDQFKELLKKIAGGKRESKIVKR